MIRSFKKEDAKSIVNLELATLGTTLGEEMLTNSLNNSMSYIYVVEMNNAVVGYISTIFDGFQLEILNFCVERNLQSKGIGRFLLGYTINQFLDKGLDNVILEVRESNKQAIHVYEKFGFKNITIRKNYYSNNENAIVMQKQIVSCYEVEENYQLCYSTKEEHDKYVKYQDLKVPTKYYSNCFLMKENDEMLMNELYKSCSKFVQFNLSTPYCGSLTLTERDNHGYYYSSIYALKYLKDASWDIRKLDEDNRFLFEALLYTDSKKFGDDYAKSNAKRHIEVSLDDNKTDWYIAFSEGMPVGAMCVYVYNGVAKIEDVFVIEEFKHQGVCQSMLKFAFVELQKSGVSDVTLVADLDDTPKDMYEKMGFVLVGQRYIVREVF